MLLLVPRVAGSKAEWLPVIIGLWAGELMGLPPLSQANQYYLGSC